MSKNNNLKWMRRKEAEKYWKENVFKSAVEVKRNKIIKKNTEKIKQKKKLRERKNATNCCRFS